MALGATTEDNVSQMGPLGSLIVMETQDPSVRSSEPELDSPVLQKGKEQLRQPKIIKRQPEPRPDGNPATPTVKNAALRGY
ncbi:hypothetical protein CJ030_MR1G004844 [Morella rubra]|uniref:Uncharacterized protein n=1 Tax=Morella rubra TaxID=262757 RepID=A0A6A1WUH8_9ROSI|nr:hypothetical protein CJ030_MR1G004844 [Morella rubra]